MTLLEQVQDDETFALVRCNDVPRYEWLKSLPRDEAPDSILIVYSHTRPHADCLLEKENQ